MLFSISARVLSVLAAVCCSFVSSAVVEPSNANQIGQYLGTKTYDLTRLGDGNYKYTQMVFRGYWDFDFGFANDCSCDCDSFAGYVSALYDDSKKREGSEKREVEKTKYQVLSQWTKTHKRPLITSVKDALAKLSESPEKRATFVKSLLRMIENDSTLKCRCCQDIYSGGAEYDYID